MAVEVTVAVRVVVEVTVAVGEPKRQRFRQPAEPAVRGKLTLPFRYAVTAVQPPPLEGAVAVNVMVSDVGDTSDGEYTT